MFHTRQEFTPISPVRTASLLAFFVLAIMQSPVHSQATAPLRQSPYHQQNAETAAGLLDINTATADQLKELPGFGLEYARRVISARPYVTKNQLVTRGVIPANAYQKVAPFIIAHHQRR